MLKNVSRLEFKIGERVYQFTCEMDSPIGEVKECLFQFLKFIGQIEDNAKNVQATEDPALEVKEDTKIELIKE